MYKRKGGPKHPRQDSISDFLKIPNDFRNEQVQINDAFGFTPFDPEHSEQCAQLTENLMVVANDNPKEPIKKVLEYANEAMKTNDPQLVRHALMGFITHHPAAREANLRIPSLVNRSPGSSIPKKQVSITPGPIIDKKVEFDDGDVELLMNWFREDPNYNEHHEHWHLVYQNRGVPDPKNPKGNRIQMDRHGELFLYMHRQMLARYDVERLGMNIPLVQPINNYRDPIQQQYIPEDQLVNSESAGSKNSTAFSSRGNNVVLGDVELGRSKIAISNMEKLRKQIEDAIDKGQFYDGTQVTTNLLGSVLESSNIPGRKNLNDFYGGLHGNGHVALAYINNPSKASDADVNPGVMSDTRTAARDPIFYRWHRHIDDLGFKWEEKLGPNDLSKSPPVKIRNGDIILAFKDKLPINQGETQDSEAADFGEKTFGGKSFDTNVSNNEFVTHVLETKMKNRLFTYVEDSGETEEIEYLYPREFYYFFRVENTSSSPLDATFRVFLVPEELVESRRHWIELDKFKQSLPPNSKTVVSRDSDMSSVVRQPPQKTEEELNDTDDRDVPPDEEQRQNRNYCDCGWPYHLLLPRGRKGGMKFKLLVFITDWSEDEVPRLSRCGSISYCGAATPSEKYPDSKPMGYPFDRPFKNNSYKETFNGLNNATIRDVTINWVDNFPEIAVST